MDHEINTLLRVSLDSIKEMIDVNTIVGEAIQVMDDVKVIPISRVRMGFLAGGSDIVSKDKEPFGGGTGGTVFISPVAFLVCNRGQVTILHLENDTHLYEKVIDYVPQLSNKIMNLFSDITDVKKI